jgi:hypothetical protein
MDSQPQPQQVFHFFLSGLIHHFVRLSLENCDVGKLKIPFVRKGLDVDIVKQQHAVPPGGREGGRKNGLRGGFSVWADHKYATAFQIVPNLQDPTQVSWSNSM